MKQIIKKTIYIILGLVGLAVGYFLNQLEFHDRLILILFCFIGGLAYWANERFGKLEQKPYECIFTKEIVSADNEKSLTSLVLQYFLPMQPFVGLSISDWDNKFYTGNILNVHWIAQNDSYSCKTEAYKMKPSETLGAVIARYYDATPWNLSILEEEAEKALEQYLEEQTQEIAKKDQTLSSTLDAQDRLERIRKKLTANKAA